MIVVSQLRKFLGGVFWNVRDDGLRTHVETIYNRVSLLVQHSEQPVAPVVVQVPAPPLVPTEVLCAKLDRLEVALGQLTERLSTVAEITATRIDEEVRRRRKQEWQAIGDLRGYEWKVFSQNGEDGIIREIFHRIGTTNKFFVEFGVETGVECNTRFLVHYENWSGLYLEPVEACVRELRERWKEKPHVRISSEGVTSANFEKLLTELEVPTDLDLLSIDIDGNDYWVWKALVNWRPRVVIIEYNPFHVPPKKWVMKENPEGRWNRTTYFGASFTSLRDLGRSKGYTLVGTDPLGVNMFFVRSDCIEPGMFLDPELQAMYQTFGHHRPCEGVGPFVEV